MKKLFALSALTLACFSSQAEIRINGFANLVGGITSSDDNTTGLGLEYDDSISFNSESLFAIQVSGDINDKTTATGQIIARAEDDYDASFEWAYLTYQATDNLSISAGRLRLPFFRYSTSLDVGYSYHWVAPPTSVYNIDFNNIDGIRFDYSNYAGDWEYNIQLAAGQVSTEVNDQSLILDNTVVLSTEATYDWFKIRGIVGIAKTTLDSSDNEDFQFILDSLNGIAALGVTAASELVNDLNLEDDTGNFIGLGLEVDKFTWFVSSEITSIETENSFTERDTAFYITAGLRLGKYTPSLTYDKKDSDEEIKFQNRITAAPEAFQPTLAALSTALQSSNFEKNETLTLGLRYDVDTNIALKADISKFEDDLDESQDATLVRFAVNYIF